VAEGARLESVYALIAYRGFESLSHRHITIHLGSPRFTKLKARKPHKRVNL
jgi:hypothetical protein